MARVEQNVRPLNDKERRLLSSAVAWRKRRLNVLRQRVVFSGIALLVAFWGMVAIATAADKRGPAWYYEGLISFAIAVSISLWVYFDLKPKFLLDLRRYENALRRNQACVTRIQSNAVVEFEEEEDEGACYAFQLDDGRIVFLSGQEFYASARFPNSDFSVVDIHADDGTLVERFIEKNGTRLKPLRKISRRNSLMEIPENFESVEGDLKEIEQIVSAVNDWKESGTWFEPASHAPLVYCAAWDDSRLRCCCSPWLRVSLRRRFTSPLLICP